MQYSDLPNDLYSELINHMDLSDVLSFCSTSTEMVKYCSKPDIIRKLKNKINTTYDIRDLNFNQLMIFAKTNLLWKNMSIYEDIGIYIHDDKMMIYNIITNSNYYLSTTPWAVNMGNIKISDIYQIKIRMYIKHRNILVLIVILNDGSSWTLSQNEPLFMGKLLAMHNDVEHGLYTIDIDGKTIQNKWLGKVSEFDFKNVVQVEGQFILNVNGEVYIKLVNGKIYNPLTNSYVNHNPYFIFRLYNQTQYYKIMDLVKQIHQLGYFLAKGEIYQFDWSTMKVVKLPYQNVDAFECYIHNGVSVAWLSDGVVYIDDEQISKDDKVAEIHISQNRLIYLDDHIHNIDLDTFEEIVTPL